jgi:hypothetical protein
MAMAVSSTHGPASLTDAWEAQGYTRKKIADDIRRQDIEAIALQNPRCPNCHAGPRRNGAGAPIDWFTYATWRKDKRYRGLIACRVCDYVEEV